MGLLDWLNPLNAITGALTRAYEVKLTTANNEDRIAADVAISNLEAQRDVVVAASLNDKWWSPRTIMAWCVTGVVFKLLIWDTALGWGVTPNPGSMVWWIIVTIIGFYFVSGSAERVADKLAGGLFRR